MAETLGRKLWEMVEEPQGRAFISDAVVEMSDREATYLAHSALHFARETVTQLERFLSHACDPHHPRGPVG